METLGRQICQEYGKSAAKATGSKHTQLRREAMWAGTSKAIKAGL
jgi:hypothetical protein